ncbi:ankyrin repeat domain-containing protein [Roseateles sp. UC29_93]|uniref:ankyrin repeat domain-containing protein n=1 Tax=Roseateles sp. UC29_93 TaxID=3350177 RepID=UPI00366DC9A3
MLALALGRLDVAEVLLDAGADSQPTDHVGRPPIFHAVMSGRTEVVRWLLERGETKVDATDDGGSTPLVDAVETDDHAMVELLLSAGADPDHEQVGFPALGCVESRTMAIRLLEAGADPSALRQEQQRLFLEATIGAERDPFEGLALVDFERDRTRRFGECNAQPMQVPLWLAMVRSGLTGYQAANQFGAEACDRARPVWCADRMGSVAHAPAGRPSGPDRWRTRGWIRSRLLHLQRCLRPSSRWSTADLRVPESLFPPTDFHTATLVGDRIIVIGSLGYPSARAHGATQVFSLNIRDWHMERLTIAGEGPGWIHKHRAALSSDRDIVVTGGQVVTKVGDEESATLNTRPFTLDLDALRWR